MVHHAATMLNRDAFTFKMFRQYPNSITTDHIEPCGHITTTIVFLVGRPYLFNNERDENVAKKGRKPSKEYKPEAGASSCTNVAKRRS